MAAKDPVKYDTVDLTGDNADDGTRYADDGGCPPIVWLTEATDDDTSSVFSKVGKGGQANGDGHRIEYDDKAGVAENDTITVHVGSLHQIDDGLELQPYTDENSVHTTVGIIIASPIVGANVFTITAAFATECNNASLTDTDNWAVRLQPVAQEAGDAGITEVDANITAGAADALQAQAWM